MEEKMSLQHLKKADRIRQLKRESSVNQKLCVKDGNNKAPYKFEETEEYQNSWRERHL